MSFDQIYKKEEYNITHDGDTPLIAWHCFPDLDFKYFTDDSMVLGRNYVTRYEIDDKGEYIRDGKGRIKKLGCVDITVTLDYDGNMTNAIEEENERITICEEGHIGCYKHKFKCTKYHPECVRHPVKSECKRLSSYRDDNLKNEIISLPYNNTKETRMSFNIFNNTVDTIFEEICDEMDSNESLVWNNICIFGRYKLTSWNSRYYIISDKITNDIISILDAPKSDLQKGDHRILYYLINNKDLLVWNDGDVYSVVYIQTINTPDYHGESVSITNISEGLPEELLLRLIDYAKQLEYESKKQKEPTKITFCWSEYNDDRFSTLSNAYAIGSKSNNQLVCKFILFIMELIIGEYTITTERFMDNFDYYSGKIILIPEIGTNVQICTAYENYIKKNGLHLKMVFELCHPIHNIESYIPKEFSKKHNIKFDEFIHIWDINKIEKWFKQKFEM
jgi:hypothetical protein